MKKRFYFSIILLVIGILLGLLKVTGMAVHIAVSVIGTVVLVLYTVVTKKEWEIVPLEIIMRVSYGIALISGIIIKISYIFAFSIIHKIFAVLFVLLLVVLFVHKLIKNK